MRILPVIDLMGGVVVRGVGGRRDEYRPVQSSLADDARPVSIGTAFRELGFTAVYVADLDAILGEPPAAGDYRTLVDCGLALWIDAGVADVVRAAELAPFADAVVAGLESLPGPDNLAGLVQSVGAGRLVFSLDLKAGQPLAGPAWNDASAESIAEAALECGVQRMIVLDLARVGEGTGVGTEPLCRWLRGRDAGLEITAGGGVRNTDDLESLAAAGCDWALVASALHDGRLGKLEFTL